MTIHDAQQCLLPSIHRTSEYLYTNHVLLNLTRRAANAVRIQHDILKHTEKDGKKALVTVHLILGGLQRRLCERLLSVKTPRVVLEEVGTKILAMVVVMIMA